jgi:hypothetical protein
VRHLKQHLPIIKEYPTLRNEFVTMLQNMRTVGQPLFFVVQPILRGLIESLAFKNLCNSHGRFVVTRDGLDNF